MHSLRYITFVVLGIITLAVVVMNVRKKKFSEKESLFWTIAGLIMVLSPIYMDYIDNLARAVGVDYAPSLIFALIFLFVFFLLYRQSATVHELNERIIELIQLNAIYENELRSLREKIDASCEKDSSGAKDSSQAQNDRGKGSE